MNFEEDIAITSEFAPLDLGGSKHLSDATLAELGGSVGPATPSEFGPLELQRSDGSKHPSDATLAELGGSVGPATPSEFGPLDTNCFKLPIAYLEESLVHKLSPTVASDLELAPTMYSTLFQPKTELTVTMIDRIKTSYTSDAEFICQTQEIIQSINPMSSESVDDARAKKLLHIWRDLYESNGIPGGFHDRYGYIDFEQLRFINKTSTFMGYWTIMNLISPIFSIILPFLFIIAPFIILRIKSVPISFSTYIYMLKDLAKSHAIGKTLTSFENFSINNFIYVIFTVAMYGLQMYQNCKHCVRFYNNIHTVNDNLLTVKEFADTSIVNIETFLKTGKMKSKYSKFCADAEKQLSVLREIKEELSGVELLEPGVFNVAKKCFDIGYLLKSYYCMHSIPEYKDAFSYAISFEAYRATLAGIAARVHTGVVNYGIIKASGPTKFQKQVYPALVDSKVSAIFNDMSLEKNLIITGPNASGKTTQLKTAAINVIFTQQFGVGFYQSCDLVPYTHIHSYLNIPDTSGRDSLFQAEARRCKEIIEIIDAESESAESRHFCIFDELFSGTNAEEATSASYSFLKYLQKRDNVDFILTTHFVKLCKKVKKNSGLLRIANCKMDAMLQPHHENGIHFTYKLVGGISKIKAAKLILMQMGFPEEIIEGL